MGTDIGDGELRRVWNQKTIPVVLRRGGKGERIRVRLPYSQHNRLWLQHGQKLQPAWIEPLQCWELPKTWFNDFVTRTLEKYKQLYVIQP